MVTALSIFSLSPSAKLVHTGRLGGGICTNSSAEFTDDGQYLFLWDSIDGVVEVINMSFVSDKEDKVDA